MRVHFNPTNGDPQRALYAADNSATAREAGRIRKKLLESAAEVESESADACVLKVEMSEETEEQRQQKNQKKQETPKRDANSEVRERSNSISDWV